MIEVSLPLALLEASLLSLYYSAKLELETYRLASKSTIVGSLGEYLKEFDLLGLFTMLASNLLLNDSFEGTPNPHFFGHC